VVLLQGDIYIADFTMLLIVHGAHGGHFLGSNPEKHHVITGTSTHVKNVKI
jgi:hypothetical protein